MPYLHKFGPDDIFTNRMETHPKSVFTMYHSSIYYNNNRHLGENIKDGYTSLYEYNVDRTSDLIYPFFVKDGNWLAFPSVSTRNYRSAAYGDIISGSYPLTASITRQPFDATTYPATPAEWDTYATNRRELIALQNTMNHYRNRWFRSAVSRFCGTS